MATTTLHDELRRLFGTRKFSSINVGRDFPDPEMASINVRRGFPEPEKASIDARLCPPEPEGTPINAGRDFGEPAGAPSDAGRDFGDRKMSPRVAARVSGERAGASNVAGWVFGKRRRAPFPATVGKKEDWTGPQRMSKVPFMANNSTPYAYDPLVQMLEDAVEGAHDFGVAVGLKQNDEAALKAVLLDLVGDPTTVPPTPGLKDKWNTAKAGKTAGTGTIRSALSNGKTIALMCMGVLKPILGTQWNSQWTTAGFTNHSLAIPDNPMTLLQQMSAYFVANPTHEVSTATIHATAADCTAKAGAIAAASGTSNTSNRTAGTAKQNLQKGIDAARSRLTGLREELGQVLADDDARWYSFGFDRPSDPTTPHVPLHVTITPGAPKMIFVDFDDAKNADAGYRVTVTDTATPPNQLAELLVAESEATFTDLPSGTAIKVVVTARNTSGGESGPSEPATGTVP